MNWLLIYLVASGFNSSPATATAQFGTRDACESAGKAIEEKWRGPYRGHLCVHLYAPSAAAQ